MKSELSQGFCFKYCMLFLFFLINGVVQQAKAQMIYVPDSNFRNALNAQLFWVCFNGDSIDASCSMVVNDTMLDISYMNIHDLTGINAFNNLKYLDCSHNFLSALPPLPTGLQSLSCEDNQLTSLPTLSNLLTELVIYANQLSSLPALPNGIQFFRCDGNQLTSIPNIPNAIVYLNCNDNQLTTLPVFPNGLQQLDCGNNLITSLPSLPNDLQILSCDNNLLTSLPILPNGFQSLTCQNNQLTSLPDLPNTVTELFCAFNQLSNIPDLPDSLTHFDCAYNPNLHCLPELKKIYYLRFDSLNITCLPNYGTVYSSNPPLTNVPICGFFNPNSCNVYWNISGNTYWDADTNCIYNSGDNRLSNYNIKLFKNGILNQQAFTGGEGYYSFDTDSITAYQTVIDTTEIPFNVRCPQSLTYNDTLAVNDTLKYNRDFALECKPGFDLAAWSINTSGLVPGDTSIFINNVGDYSNLFGGRCASGISGIVTIVYNGYLHYVSGAIGALTPTSISGNTLTYYVPDFGLLNAFTDFDFLAIVDTNAVYGSQVCITVAVSPAIDNNPANNTISQCFTVLSSFDPNEKEVSPKNSLDINGDRWLTYTIHFQNTGTAPAEHIYILDSLNSNLDFSTFQLLSYSKQPYVQILNVGVVKFNFQNINLPDSGSNESGSHGYVQYRIKTLNNLPVGTQISNTAFIYFDFNTPVVTNTVVNSVINCPQNIQNISVTACSNEYIFNGLHLTQSGNYTQKFTTTSGCDSTVNLSLTILAQITNSITQSHDTLTALDNNATYQWYNCVSGILIAGANSQSFIPATNGYYAVIIANANCTDTSACMYVSLTGINENSFTDLTISPNPSSNVFTVSYQQKNNNTVSIKIIDAFGKLITQQQLNAGKTILKAENWSTGIYFVEITDGKNVQVRKLVKE